MGNVLCADDGFGVVVAEALAARRLPPRVKVVEVGIGGMHLVQELMAGWDALIIIDAVERGAPPGALFVLEPDPDEVVQPAQAWAALTDIHYTVPAQVLAMAKALGVLPARVLIVGCQGAAVDELRLDLSAPVRRAVAGALETIEALVAQLHAAEPAPASWSARDARPA
jgi:hydrogenase maturation protease